MTTFRAWMLTNPFLNYFFPRFVRWLNTSNRIWPINEWAWSRMIFCSDKIISFFFAKSLFPCLHCQTVRIYGFSFSIAIRRHKWRRTQNDGRILCRSSGEVAGERVNDQENVRNWSIKRLQSIKSSVFSCVWVCVCVRQRQQQFKRIFGETELKRLLPLPHPRRTSCLRNGSIEVDDDDIARGSRGDGSSNVLIVTYIK